MIPTLTTKRLTLDAFRIEDSDQVELLAGNEAVARTTLNIPHPYPKGAARLWIAEHLTAFLKDERISFAIRLREELIGCIGLTIFRTDDRAELGYWIAEPHWGNGFATEAAETCVRYAFESLGLHKISAHHYQNNPASGRVMEKIGMRPEGHLREHIKKAGVRMNVIQYGLLKPEFRTA